MLPGLRPFPDGASWLYTNPLFALPDKRGLSSFRNSHGQYPHEVADVYKRAVRLIPVIVISRVHDPITELIFESFKFHHRTVIELVLSFAGERLGITLNRRFGFFKFLNDAVPCCKVQNRAFGNLNSSVSRQSAHAMFCCTHQM